MMQRSAIMIKPDIALLPPATTDFSASLRGAERRSNRILEACDCLATLAMTIFSASLRGAERRSNRIFEVCDCFAALAMTIFSVSLRGAERRSNRILEACNCFAAHAMTRVTARRAFTMMEIITVMAIISVVSSIVLPAITNFYSSERVKAEAEILVQNVRLGKYKAMQEQALHRLIFSPGGDAYKVQIHADYLKGATPPDLSTVLTDAGYDSLNWESILENEENSIDPMVVVTREAYLQPRIIYFWPDGCLMTHDSTGISEANKKRLGECFVLFEYGSSRIRVYLNAYGVLSSESYAADDDGDAEADVLW